MKTKIENDTASFAQSIADKRHRNAGMGHPPCAKAPPSPAKKR
jgi:hypothetical protein